MIFCEVPEKDFIGIQSSNLKNRHKNVKKFVIKTGMMKMDFRLFDLDFKSNKKSELNTAKNEAKSPNQANAKAENIDVENKTKNDFVFNFSGVAKKVSKAYAKARMLKFNPIFSS